MARKKEERNPLTETVLLGCAKLLLLARRPESFEKKPPAVRFLYADEEIFDVFQGIAEKSQKLYQYILTGFALLNDAIVPECIHITMEYEFFKLLGNISVQELEAAVVFKAIVTDAMQEKNADFLETVFEGERDRRFMPVPVVHQIRKLFNSYFEWEAIFCPQYLPAGYSMKEVVGNRECIFSNKEGNKIHFCQNWEVFPKETAKKVQINGAAGYFERNGEDTSLYWDIEYRGHTYHFLLKGKMTGIEELLKIAQSNACGREPE